MYGLQHGALAHTEQQAIKGPKITTSVKLFKWENQRSKSNYILRLKFGTYKLFVKPWSKLMKLSWRKTRIAQE